MHGMKHHLPSFTKAGLFFLLPLAVLAWTSIDAVIPYTAHLAVMLFLVAIGANFIKEASWQWLKTTLQVATILLLVGATGWFFSPFFFLLYLVPLYLGFLFTPLIAFSFLAGLLIIFSASVGEVNVAYDAMTLLSLLLVIPLVIYLRKKYLLLRQTSKDILILQEEGGVRNVDTIQRLLANRVTNLGVTVRQPLTFIKQAATILLDEKLDTDEVTTYLKRIHTTATETLEHIREFEGKTSANEMLMNNKNSDKKTIKKP